MNEDKELQTAKVVEKKGLKDKFSAVSNTVEKKVTEIAKRTT